MRHLMQGSVFLILALLVSKGQGALKPGGYYIYAMGTDACGGQFLNYNYEKDSKTGKTIGKVFLTASTTTTATLWQVRGVEGKPEQITISSSALGNNASDFKLSYSRTSCTDGKVILSKYGGAKWEYTASGLLLATERKCNSTDPRSRTAFIPARAMESTCAGSVELMSPQREESSLYFWYFKRPDDVMLFGDPAVPWDALAFDNNTLTTVNDYDATIFRKTSKYGIWERTVVQQPWKPRERAMFPGVSLSQRFIALGTAGYTKVRPRPPKDIQGTVLVYEKDQVITDSKPQTFTSEGPGMDFGWKGHFGVSDAGLNSYLVVGDGNNARVNTFQYTKDKVWRKTGVLQMPGYEPNATLHYGIDNSLQVSRSYFAITLSGRGYGNPWRPYSNSNVWIFEADSATGKFIKKSIIKPYLAGGISSYKPSISLYNLNLVVNFPQSDNAIDFYRREDGPKGQWKLVNRAPIASRYFEMSISDDLCVVYLSENRQIAVYERSATTGLWEFKQKLPKMPSIVGNRKFYLKTFALFNRQVVLSGFYSKESEFQAQTPPVAVFLNIE